jgi:hypothetical protein
VSWHPATFGAGVKPRALPLLASAQARGTIGASRRWCRS